MSQTIEKLGGTVCVQHRQDFDDGQKIGEEWHVLDCREILSENSNVSLEDALTKLSDARKANAAEPKVAYVHKYDSEDYELFDELLSCATLLESIEQDIIDGDQWLDGRMAAIVSATGKKLFEIHEKLYSKA